MEAQQRMPSGRRCRAAVRSGALRPGPLCCPRRFGEPWTRASWLQALGFAMLASGTVVYSHADQLRSHTSATGLLSRFRRRRRQRHAAGAPAADAEASRAGGSDAA